MLVGDLCVQLSLSHRHLLRSSPDPVLSADRNLEVEGECEGGGSEKMRDREKENEAARAKKTPNLL